MHASVYMSAEKTRHSVLMVSCNCISLYPLEMKISSLVRLQFVLYYLYRPPYLGDCSTCGAHLGIQFCFIQEGRKEKTYTIIILSSPLPISDFITAISLFFLFKIVLI